MAAGWGGAREGAGRKPDDYEPSEGKADYDKIRAEHEQVKLEQRAFALAKERGEYLPRAAQRQAAATLLAVLTQSLRSVPDNLERACNLSPEQAEAAAQQIDAALAEAAAAIKAMTLDA